MTDTQPNTCLIGDVRAVLPTLPDDSVHCCVTSPPYWGLRDYGADGQLGLEATPEEYVANMVDVFREVRRALRDDGTLWLNLGDSYCASSGGGVQGKNSKFLDRTAARLGVREQKLDKSLAPGLKPKDLVGIPWMVALALRSDGWWLRSDIVWSKPNPMPESVGDRPSKAHEYVFLLSKNAEYHYDAKAIAEPADPGSAARYAYSFGGSKAEILTEAEADGPGTRTRPIGQREYSGTRNSRTVWTIPTEPYHGAHFACFPRQLAQRCILAGCPLGGMVLDPFFGSGTTGQVAESLGRRWLGVELNPEYEPLWRERTKQQGLAFGGGE
jgi:DNA modification methylase